MQKDTEDALRDRGEQVLQRTVSPQGGKEGRIPGGPTRQGAAVKPECQTTMVGFVEKATQTFDDRPRCPNQTRRLAEITAAAIIETNSGLFKVRIG